MMMPFNCSFRNKNDYNNRKKLEFFLLISWFIGVRAGEKNKICFVIYFSGEKKKKKILCFVIVKQKKKERCYYTTDRRPVVSKRPLHSRAAAKMSPHIRIGPEPVLAAHARSPPAAGSHRPDREDWQAHWGLPWI